MGRDSMMESVVDRFCSGCLGGASVVVACHQSAGLSPITAAGQGLQGACNDTQVQSGSLLLWTNRKLERREIQCRVTDQEKRKRKEEERDALSLVSPQVFSRMASAIATAEKGATVISASSFSRAHPPSAIIDKNPGSFWITTGSFPQEIVVQLAESSSIKSVEIVSMGIRSVELWGSDGYTHSAGERIGKMEAADLDGELQRFSLPISSKSTNATCLRLKILSGWSDYCSIHRFNVSGSPAERK